MLRQHIIVGRDSEIAPTEHPLCRRELRFPITFKTHQLSLDEALTVPY